MSTLTLELLKYSGNYKKGRFCPPIAYIALKSAELKELPTESGKEKIMRHIISVRCHGPSDIEYEIERLTRELETIGKQGKSFFQKDVKKSIAQAVGNLELLTKIKVAQL